MENLLWTFKIDNGRFVLSTNQSAHVYVIKDRETKLPIERILWDLRVTIYNKTLFSREQVTVSDDGSFVGKNRGAVIYLGFCSFFGIDKNDWTRAKQYYDCCARLLGGVQ